MNLDTRGMPNPGHCQQGRRWLLLLSKEIRLQMQGFDSWDQQINLKTISCIADIILDTGIIMPHESNWQEQKPF